MDEHLTFNYHVKKIINKINSAMFHISAVRSFLSKASLTKLYYALVHPHILYCLPVYSFTSLANRKKILKRLPQLKKFFDMFLDMLRGIGKIFFFFDFDFFSEIWGKLS